MAGVFESESYGYGGRDIEAVSSAISLKRIADGVERMAKVMEEIKSNPHLFSVMAENAGQAFNLGVRGR